MTPRAPARNGWGSVATGGAAHEVAHGVIAWAHRIPVERLVLHTTGDGTEWRSGFNQLSGSATAKLDADPLTDGVIVAAGAEGHRLWLVKQGVPEGQAATLGLESAAGDSSYLADLVRRSNGELSEAGIRSVAAREVELHWPTIEEVANRLAEKHRLGGWAVR